MNQPPCICCLGHLHHLFQATQYVDSLKLEVAVELPCSRCETWNEADLRCSWCWTTRLHMLLTCPLCMRPSEDSTLNDRGLSWWNTLASIYLDCPAKPLMKTGSDFWKFKSLYSSVSSLSREWMLSSGKDRFCPINSARVSPVEPGMVCCVNRNFAKQQFRLLSQTLHSDFLVSQTILSACPLVSGW